MRIVIVIVKTTRHKLDTLLVVCMSCVACWLQKRSGMTGFANTYINASKAYGAHPSSLTATTNEITVQRRSQDGLNGNASYVATASKITNTCDK